MTSDSSLTNLESSVLDMLLSGDHPVLAVLRAQAAECCVESREFTGHGFFAQLVVGGGMAPLSTKRIAIEGVGADIHGMHHGAGFVLFVSDGYLDFLEGYAYDEPWPDDVTEFSLFFTGERAENPDALDFDGS